MIFCCVKERNDLIVNIIKQEIDIEDAHYHHDFRYLFTIDKIEDVELDYNEATGYIWVSIDELKNNNNFSYVIHKIESIINK